MSSMHRLDPVLTTLRAPARLDVSQIEAAQRHGSATLHEASGKSGAMPSAIKPVAPEFRLGGTAVTVHAPGGDNLWLHRAIYEATAGDVLVVSVGGQFDHGYWGGIMSIAAKARKLSGLVIDGCVRDVMLLRRLAFPVFSRGLCIRGTTKDFGARGWINAPVRFDDVTVTPGDLIVGDEDGVVSIARDQIPAVLDLARKREEDEAEIVRRLGDGATTLDLYGWR